MDMSGLPGARDLREAQLACGIELTRALGIHLTTLLGLARDMADQERLAREATRPELRAAHLALAAGFQRQIDGLRRAHQAEPADVDRHLALWGVRIGT